MIKIHMNLFPKEFKDTMFSQVHTQFGCLCTVLGSDWQARLPVNLFNDNPIHATLREET